MKLKEAGSSTQRKGPRSPGLRCAYDLKAERENCKSAVMQSRVVVAWMEGRRVMYSLVSEWETELRRSTKRQEIYERWLQQSVLAVPTSPTPEASRTPASKCVRCLIASGGAGWGIWKYQEVLRALSPLSGDPACERVEWLPAEYTLFDPDKEPDVWLKEYEKPEGQRCLEWGKAWLWDTARVFELCIHSMEDFELIYDSPHHRIGGNKATMLANLLRSCVQAIDRLFYIAAIQDYHDRNPMDAAVALRQGFLIGQWLMRAEAIVSNADALQLASRQGVTGQHLSRFWHWVITEPLLAGKSAKEIFGMLDGKEDPEFPKKLMVVTGDNKLRRGDGSLLLQSSFCAGLSRARKTMHKRKN